MSDEIKLWLTRAILSQGLHEGGRDPGFGHPQWRALQTCVAQHRLQQLLHTFAIGPWRDWSIPMALRKRWLNTHKSANQRLEEHRAKLAEVAAVLDEMGCPYAALKGSLLVETVYADPVTRPIRDLDILVPRDRAQAVFQALIDQCGCVPVSQETGYLLEDYSDHKHLEPLWCAARKVTIELHVALADKPRGARESDILFDTQRLLDRTQVHEVAGYPVGFLAWPETLLHLIAHGVHDHQLNSGPLLLCDALAIAQHAPLDWDEFWQFAQAGGWSGAARLTLDLVEEYTTPPPHLDLTPSGYPPSPEAVREAAVLLLLQDTQREAAVGSWSRLHAGASLGDIVALVRRRWRAHGRADRQGEGSPLRRRSRLAQLGAMLAALVRPIGRREIARSRTIYSWLNRRAS